MGQGACGSLPGSRHPVGGIGLARPRNGILGHQRQESHLATTLLARPWSRNELYGITLANYDHCHRNGPAVAVSSSDEPIAFSAAFCRTWPAKFGSLSSIPMGCPRSSPQGLGWKTLPLFWIRHFLECTSASLRLESFHPL